MAEPARVYVYIDAAQIRAQLQEWSEDWRELNLGALAIVARGAASPTGKWAGRSLQVARTYIYDAVPEGAEAPTDEVQRWLERNDHEMDVHIRRGAKLAMDPTKPKWFSQKGVDVQLAVDALEAAAAGNCEASLIVSGDGDFVPLVEALKRSGQLVLVATFESKLSPMLRQAADRVGYLPDDVAAYQAWKLPPAQ